MEKMSDSKLYSLCKKYGNNARSWMRKFAGLLPEVYRRRLYKRRGFCSIHEFAAKLAGMSNAAVDRILQLDKKLEDKPKLREQLTSGDVGWGNLKTVAYVATPETDAFWAEKTRTLTKPALEAYVQSRKTVPGDSFEPVKCAKMPINVNPETHEKLKQLKHKLEEEKKEPLDWNTVMELMLEMVGKTETKVIEVCKSCAEKKQETNKRYVSVKIRKLLRAQYNNHCGMCTEKIHNFHHTKRFALSKNHKDIVPLCKKHHQLAHSALLVEIGPPSEWRIIESVDIHDPKYFIDLKVQEHWKG